MYKLGQLAQLNAILPKDRYASNNYYTYAPQKVGIANTRRRGMATRSRSRRVYRKRRRTMFRRRRPWRRRFRRRMRGRRRRRTIVRLRSESRGVVKNLTMVLNYTPNSGSNCYVSDSILLNDIGDPSGDGGNQRPVLYDQMFTYFNKARVLRTFYDCKVTSADLGTLQTAGWRWGISFCDDDRIKTGEPYTPLVGQQTLMILRSSRYKMIPVAGHLGADGKESSYVALHGQRIKGSVDVRNWFPGVDKRDNGWAVEKETHPTRKGYMNLWSGPCNFSDVNNGPLNIQVWLTFKVYFFEPKPIGFSMDNV